MTIQDEASGRAASEWTPALVVSCCALVALAGRLVYLRHPWDGDAGMFVCCGRAVAGGARFCHDIYDNKFPTAALWSAVWWRACGVFWPAYVVGGAAMAFVASGVLAVIARRHAGREAALPTFLFALVYLNFCPVVFGGFQLETAVTTFATIAAAFAVEALVSGRAGPALVCGLVAGVAAYLKPTGLAVVGVFGVVAIGQWMVGRLTFRAVMMQGVALLAGVAIPIVGALFYLHAADIFQDMPWLYRQISAYAKQSVWDGYSVVKLVTAAVFIALPIWMRVRLVPLPPVRRGAGLGVRGESQIANLRSQIQEPLTPALSPEYRGEGGLPRTLLAWFAASWLVVEFTAVAMQGRMYSYHFLVVAAPAALLFGLIPRATSLRSTLVPILPAILFSLWGSAWQLVRPETSRLPVSDYLVAHAKPDDRVWMDNMCRLLLETNLSPGTRYFQTFPFFNTDTAPLEMGPQLVADLAERRPRFVVLPTDTIEALDRHCAYMAELAERPIRRANFRAAWLNAVAYVQAHYRPTAQVGERTVWEISNPKSQISDSESQVSDVRSAPSPAVPLP